MVSRGEVWWYEPVEGGRRPYLVLTRSEAAAVLNQVLAAPVTTVVRGIPTEVALDQGDGLPRSCVVNLDGAHPIRPTLCTERITALGPVRMAEVCEALRVSIDC